MLPLILTLQAAAAATGTDLIAAAHLLTAAEPGCHRDADATDITVCGMRNADRFRVPFVGYEPGDPRAEGVPAERQRLLARTDNCQERKAILAGCGFAGVHVTSSGRGTSVTGARKLAP